MTPERASQILTEYESAGSTRALAPVLGVSKSRAHQLVVEARGVENTPRSFTTTSISTRTNKYGEPVGHSVKAAAKGRGRVHEVPEGMSLSRLSSLVDREGRVFLEWRIATKDGQRLEDMVTAMRAELADLPRAAPVGPPSLGREEIATLYPVADQHHGLYAWKPEAGEDFDLTISDSLFRDRLARLVAGSQPSRRAIILGLGDFFHADKVDAKTEISGHFLDRDGRQAKVTSSGVRLIIWAIDLALTKHEIVHVRMLGGNHDPMSALWLTELLAIRYEHEPRVTVDQTPSLFWYARFGRVLLAGSHGHTVKPAEFAGVMAANAGGAWGETNHRFGFMGHIHHETKLERGGAIVETLQTITAKDAWHAGKGYSAGRSMTALTFHREHGLVGRQWAPVVVDRADASERVTVL